MVRLIVPGHPFSINEARGGGSRVSAPSVSPVDVVACFNLKLDHLLSARNEGNNFNLLGALPSGSLELQVYLVLSA